MSDFDGSWLSGSVTGKGSTTSKKEEDKKSSSSSGSGGSSSGGGFQDGGTKTTIPTYKPATYSQSTLQKAIAKYGSKEAVEEALKAKGYTLGEDITKKTDVSTPGSLKTKRFDDDVSDISGTDKGVSSKLKETKAEQMKRLTDDNKDAYEIRIKEALEKAGSQSSEKMEEINDALLKKGYKYLDGKLVKLSSVEKSKEEGIDKFEAETQKAAEDRAGIRSEIAEEKTDLIEQKNIEKEKRIQDRMDNLDKVMSKYRANVQQRKAEIDKSLEKQKEAQLQQANIGAAIAGQGPGVSEGEALQVGADLAARATKGITEAEQIAIKNKSDLDLQLKNAGLEEGQVTDQMNTILNSFTDAEYQEFLDELDANGGDFVAAITKVEGLITELSKGEITETQNRVLRDRRIKENETTFKEGDIGDKLGLALEHLNSVEGAAYLKAADIKKYISENKGASLKEVVSYFENIAKESSDEKALKQIFDTYNAPIALQTKMLEDPDVKAWILENFNK